MDVPGRTPLGVNTAAVIRIGPGKRVNPGEGRICPDASMRRRIAGCRACLSVCPFTRSSPLSSEETTPRQFFVSGRHAVGDDDVVEVAGGVVRSLMTKNSSGKSVRMLPRGFRRRPRRMLLVS